MQNSPLPRQLRIGGIAILLIGWACAALIYLFADNPDGLDPDSADYQMINGHVVAQPFSASKRQQLEVERLGGSASVYIVEFDSWLGTLWHGRRLAWTLAAASALAAGACLYIAGLAGEDVGD